MSIVVAVKDPPYHKSLIEKYITAARGSNLDVTIVFNKADLCIDEETAVDIQNYRELGYKVFLTSTLTGQGLEEAEAECRNLFGNEINLNIPKQLLKALEKIRNKD